MEVNGGYLWSPKTPANNRVNPFYDFMTKVEIGDVIFSFKDTLISAIGIASSKAYPTRQLHRSVFLLCIWIVEVKIRMMHLRADACKMVIKVLS